MPLMPRQATGQSLTEYVMIVALIVLVAVPALMFLGSGFHKNIDQVSTEQSRVNSGGNDAAGGKPDSLDTENAGSGFGASSDAVGDNADTERPALEKDEMLIGNGWTAKYDEETKEMIYSVNDSNDNGTNTASVQGLQMSATIRTSPAMTRAIAGQINNLSQMNDANGEPLPEDLQARLVALGNIGINMGNTEKILVQEYTQNGVTLFNALIMDQKIRQLHAQHEQFSSIFNELHTLLAANSDYQNVMSRFLGLAGMISYVADVNFFDPAGQYLPAYTDIAVVGRKPKRVPSILEAADVTTGSAQAIVGLTP